MTNTQYNANQNGTAYAFFDCNGSLGEVHKEIKDLASALPRDTQSKLELSLEGMSNFRKSSEDLELLHVIDSVPLYPIFSAKARKLKKEATPLRMSNLGYVLTAKYDGTNNDAGDALCYLMNGVRARYNMDLVFPGQIVGKGSNGHYDFWQNEELQQAA